MKQYLGLWFLLFLIRESKSANCAGCVPLGIIVTTFFLIFKLKIKIDVFFSFLHCTRKPTKKEPLMTTCYSNVNIYKDKFRSLSLNILPPVDQPFRPVISPTD